MKYRFHSYNKNNNKKNEQKGVEAKGKKHAHTRAHIYEHISKISLIRLNV